MSDQQPQVVVACAWYNRADYIRDTVDSLLAQEFDSFEIVIVNDGSTDPRVKNILDSYSDPKLRIIHQKNTGFVRAISRAIESSNAPYIAIQGSGDISHPKRISKQWEAMQEDVKLALVACRVENILDVKNNIKKIYGKVFYGDAKEEVLHRVLLMHGEAFYRRDLYEKVGGYRSFFKFSQDRDLWCRLSREGGFCVLNDVLYTRYANIGGVSGNAQNQIYQRLLGHFAVYCHKEVLSGKQDPLEKFGSQAGLLFEGNFSLQKDLIRLALRYYLDGNEDEFILILDSAKSKRSNFFIPHAIEIFSKLPFVFKFSLKALKKIK